MHWGGRARARSRWEAGQRRRAADQPELGQDNTGEVELAGGSSGGRDWTKGRLGKSPDAGGKIVVGKAELGLTGAGEGVQQEGSSSRGSALGWHAGEVELLLPDLGLVRLLWNYSKWNDRLICINID